MHKLVISIFVLVAGLSVLSLSPQIAYSQCDPPPTDTKEAIKCGTAIPPTSDPESALQKTITNSVNILTLVIGMVAVIMMIYAGYLFITSSGDANRVATAKKALLYAIIGVAVVAVAQVLTQFVATKLFQ